jgi:hypothetical protein
MTTTERSAAQHTPILRLLFILLLTFYSSSWRGSTGGSTETDLCDEHCYDCRGWIIIVAKKEESRVWWPLRFNNSQCRGRSSIDRFIEQPPTKDGAVEDSPSPVEVVVWLTLLHVTVYLQRMGWPKQQL